MRVSRDELTIGPTKIRRNKMIRHFACNMPTLPLGAGRLISGNGASKKINFGDFKIVVGPVLDAIRAANITGQSLTLEGAFHKVCTDKELDGITLKKFADMIRIQSHEGSNSSCFYFLGRMLHLGQGVPKNKSEAVQWYTKAAELGDPDAQFLLRSSLLTELGESDALEEPVPKPKANLMQSSLLGEMAKKSSESSNASAEPAAAASAPKPAPQNSKAPINISDSDDDSDSDFEDALSQRKNAPASKSKETLASSKKTVEFAKPGGKGDGDIGSAGAGVLSKDAPDLQCRLTHAHATLSFLSTIQAAKEGRDLCVLKYIPLEHSVAFEVFGDRAREILAPAQYTVCGHRANVKFVRESMEWDTRVQEHGGKVNFLTHNDAEFDPASMRSCSSLQGYVAANYDRLVEVFGQPYTFDADDADKCDWEWEIRFEDGTYASIYNYKNGPNYLGVEGGLSKYQIGTGAPVKNGSGADDWHVGGGGLQAVAHVENALNFS